MTWVTLEKNWNGHVQTFKKKKLLGVTQRGEKDFVQLLTAV